MHAMRDCSTAKQVWNFLLPQGVLGEFYSFELKDWLVWLLTRSSNGCFTTRWVERMVLTCWMIWKWRYEETFKGCRAELQQRLRILHGLFDEDDLLRRAGSLKLLDPTRAFTQAM